MARVKAAAARLAAHAVGTAARSARSLAARHRDRGHRPWAGAGGALERPDQGRRMPSRWPSIRCSSRRSSPISSPTLDRAGAACGASSRCAGICDRRHDLALQGGARRSTTRPSRTRCSRAIHIRFGLPPKSPPALGSADQDGRPDRRLSRSHPACRFQRRGSVKVLRYARASSKDGQQGLLRT